MKGRWPTNHVAAAEGMAEGDHEAAVLGFYCRMMTTQPSVSRWQRTSAFCNKCDFVAQFEILRELQANLDNLTLFVTGTYDGSDIHRLTQQKWYRANRTRVYGWEIQPTVHGRASAQLKQHAEVQIFHAGVSDRAGRVGLAGKKELAHLDAALTNATTYVDVVCWADFAESRSIPLVDYALIDTEGHDVNVMRGMNLGEPGRFPMLQYEIGPGWVDSAGRLIAPATQVEVADWLTSLGYKLFIMGRRLLDWRNSSSLTPILLPVTPSTFRDSWCTHTRWNMRRNNSMQGNVLAIHVMHLRRHAWLAHRVRGMEPTL